MPGCHLQPLGVQGSFQDGDIILGGIFPIHYKTAFTKISFTEPPGRPSCEIFSLRAYRWVLSMLFSIHEINRNPAVLPNLTLGFGILDSCNEVNGALEGTTRLTTETGAAILNYQCQDSPLRLLAIIGDAGMAQTVAMAQLLGLYWLPQVSYFNAIPISNDKHLFPSFFSIAPASHLQTYGLARLVAHFGWTWVGILSQDGDPSRLSSQIFRDEIMKAGACVAFSEVIPASFSKTRTEHILGVIKRSSAKVIAILSFEVYTNRFMEELFMLDHTGRIWISLEAPSVSNEKLARAVDGTLGLVIRNGKMPGFEEFVFSLKTSRFPNDPYVKMFWEEAFGCQWTEIPEGTRPLGIRPKPCSGAEKLRDVGIYPDIDDLRVTYNVYKSAYAVAHALHALLTCHPGNGPFAEGSCASLCNYKPWQLAHYVRVVRFEANIHDEIFFDSNGYTPPLYDVINWKMNSDGSVSFIKVGSFDTSAPQGQDLVINNSAILWKNADQQPPRSVCSESCTPGYRKVERSGEPACCFDCLSCSDGEISNQSDSIQCLKCPEDHWPNQHQDKCVPKEVEFLGFSEPMGVLLASVAVTGSLLPVTIVCIFIKHQETPIVKANNRALSYLLLLALTVCYLCPLIFIGRPTIWTCMLRQAAFGIMFTFSLSCMLAKTIVVVLAFNATKPNSQLKSCVGPTLPNSVVLICTFLQVILCASWLVTSPPFPEKNVASQLGKIIIECNEGSAKAFWCMLGYMCFLAGVSFVLAFLARTLPDSFNEAKHITFSMLLCGSVWVSFIPAYVSTRGKHMVAVEIFAILASSTGLVMCMFVPKCYIILLRPDMNTKEYLLGSKTIKSFGFRSYPWVLSMLFTIDEINHNPALLPNLTMGLGIIDSCNTVRRALDGIARLREGKGKAVLNYQCQHYHSRVLAIIGDAGMAQTVAMAQLLGLYRLPQIQQHGFSAVAWTKAGLAQAKYVGGF
ncbi:extracellular calcium-sensing receptor-like [Ambystoma mexicanum]|uniref:extracellular calcium-sensing receptor-like n=1 Tax=Ambystoma mexicanum TaxID=8296 RepID=UPI0037E99306